jgi:1-(5-phosphoribosyl)-5-[(5-phosphoribosylamino)methylideneamino] imidazole-4-carboxamide isomerase/N-(5'phosphoribosyl)anthranilate isomerase
VESAQATADLVLLPAVDVAGGQAVQLVQGVAGTEKKFGDPRAAAERWQQAGARWLHLVDLDAAFGRGDNAAIIAEVVRAMKIDVEISGGIRDDESLERALATGCTRVNIGTAALERPEWCEEAIRSYGDKIAVGLDVRGRRLAARGWTRDGGELYETLDRLEAAGCARYVVTDVASDGMLSGPNLDLLRKVCERTNAPVVASGGISRLTDIIALAEMVPLGVEGAIIGTAALERPEWCEQAIGRYGDKIAVGLDVRGRRLAARGWTRDAGELYETLERLEGAGCARYVVTDVASDGMLSGPNLDLLRRVCEHTKAPVVASGGISRLTDIIALAEMVALGVEGAIIGTALYVGNFTLEEALRAAEAPGSDHRKSGNA